MNRSKNIGTAAETAVVRYLRTWWPSAERRALAGSHDLGDILTPGICWEIKAGRAAETAGDGQVETWLAETETERRNSRADVGVLVLKRAGFGAERVGHWWAVLPAFEVTHLGWNADGTDAYHRAAGLRAPVRMHLGTAVELLVRAGYGTPARDVA